MEKHNFLGWEDDHLSQVDLYEVLGCNKHSTHEEIKHAYHQRLLQLHPDKNDGDTVDIYEFERVKEAWRVLGDPLSRVYYDAIRKQKELEEGGGDEDLDGPLYALISVKDLEETLFEGIFSYKCRCGDNYYVYQEDLRENTVHQVTCEGCTHVILVQT